MVKSVGWSTVDTEVRYPSEMWSSPRDGCDGRYQGGWSPMLARTHWDPEVGGRNR